MNKILITLLRSESTNEATVLVECEMKARDEIRYSIQKKKKTGKYPTAMHAVTYKPIITPQKS